MHQIAPLRLPFKAGLSRRAAGIRSAVDRAVQRKYEFTMPRIVTVAIAIVLWLLLSVGAGRQSDDPSGAVGAFLGSLLPSLVLSWAVRRRPVIQPAWTAGLFVGAATVALLSAAGNAAPPS
jgi:hypothetical protein